MKYLFLSLIIGCYLQFASAQYYPNNHAGESDELNQHLWSYTHPSPGLFNKPIIDFTTIERWTSLGHDNNLSISNNGRYCSFVVEQLTKGKKIEVLVIKATNNSWQLQFPGATPVAFSADSKQFIFQQDADLCFLSMGDSLPRRVKDIASHTLPMKGKREWLAYQLQNGRSTVTIHNLLTNQEQHIDSVASYLFHVTGKWLACKLNNEANELVLFNLANGSTRRFKSITRFTLGREGKLMLLATTSPKKTTVGQSLQMVRLATGELTSVWAPEDDSPILENYTMDEAREQIVFSTVQKNDDKADRSIWYYKTDMQKPVIKVSSQTAGVEKTLLINGDPEFSDDGNYIFFSLQQPPDLRKPSPDAIKVDVWSYRDTMLQSAQLFKIKRMPDPVPRNYRAYISTAGSQVMRLEMNNYEQALGAIHDHCIITTSKYLEINDRFWEREKFNAEHGDRLVSLKDSGKTVLLFKSMKPVGAPPDNNYLVFFDRQQGHYFSYNFRTSKLVNISTNIPAGQLSWQSRYHKKDISNDKTWPDYEMGVAGWLENNTALLVYDNYDIWQLDLAGKKTPINITNGYGQKNQIKLRLTYGFNNIRIYPVNTQLLLTAYNETNKQNGFYQTTLGKKTDPTLLYMGPYVFDLDGRLIPGSYFPNGQGMKPLKAEESNAWIIKRQSATEGQNYYFTTDFKQYTALTDLHPHQQYNWLTAELHTFTQADGTPSEGILYKPQNFDPAKKYPVIVSYYEQHSPRLYQYPTPEITIDAHINIPWFVSRGYLVFMPDIYFSNAREPGASALNTMVGVARYLGSLPFVNAQKLGLSGHSFAGGLTYHLVTHTSLYAAAFAGAAPVSDWISNELQLNGNNWGKTSRLGHGERSRRGISIWESPALWTKESPIIHVDKVTTPLLIFHAEADDGWLQSLEMYMAMRRLHKKSWMLQYDEGNHGLNDKDAVDLTIRATQFFDHYLKNAPPPRWMTQGIPARLKGIESRYELDISGNIP